MDQPGQAPVPASKSASEVVTVGGAPVNDPMNLSKGPTGEVPNQSPETLEPYVPSEPTLYRGTDEVVRMPQPRQPVRLYGDAVSLNFEQAPLVEVSTLR